MNEMLQKTENVAKNVANENSQHLTEQWKKGELPEGEYWVKYIFYGDIERLDYCWKTFNDNGYPINNETIEQVLAPVPSYDEWKAKLEENAELKEQINKSCLDAINRGTANTVKAVKEFGMPERIKELVEQNKELKERCERLEEALFEAVCTLETYADAENWRDIFEEDGDDSEYHSEALYFADEGYEAARSALQQIKGLEK